ncbi:hypothetical protein SISSUDRAFT_87673 [Sistotremastrum suecicum HHB10207 ss-3]|uniref:MYND-type domain-containing protein n=1 Tax=Sistotremastrum suecicum HHB10207 ss-3 TaxID=1314776 RepID=A0A166BBL3_9AGAM|nr:hypothetical protein SISSUDRAFT_87673 [Sistotremastrum suecicum HHB10207 ss-3]
MRTCVVCKTPTKKTCTGCSRITYCSAQCQRKHWICHIIDCENPGREITTADRLAASLFGHYILHDKQTMSDYGFCRISGPEEVKFLFLVYHEMFQVFGIKPPTLHKWRVEGRLYQELIATYERAGAGENPANKNFLWLSEHPQIFYSEAGENRLKGQEDYMALKAWTYIGGSESTSPEDVIEEVDNWPYRRRICFLFYMTMVGSDGPPMDLPVFWMDYGFCVFTDHIAEPLQKLYSLLLQRCTFEEFCDAYATSSLITLMDRKGLRDARRKMPDALEVVLSQSPDNISPIWHLKSFALSPEANYRWGALIPYGFANCPDRTESNQLRHFYARLFTEWKVSPLQLHNAAMQDCIFEYLRVLRTHNRRIFIEGSSTTEQWQTLYKWTFTFIIYLAFSASP